MIMLNFTCFYLLIVPAMITAATLKLPLINSQSKIDLDYYENQKNFLNTGLTRSLINFVKNENQPPEMVGSKCWSDLKQFVSDLDGENIFAIEGN